jgi:hypothetical protein
MKLPKLLLTSAAFAAASLTALAEFSWDFAAASGSGGSAEVAETSGTFPLVFATGASVTADAGKNVLDLSGDQAEAGQTARALPAFPSVEINLKFKPTGKGADRQTLVAFGNAYELRYNTRGNLEFIVFHPEKKFTIAQVKVAPGQWHEVKATYQGGKVTLSLGKTTVEKSLPAGIDIEAKGTRLRVGRQGDRAFAGSIASLSIKEL